MAGQELTQSTTIYVLIAPATYSLAAMSLQGAYTDLRAAQEAANEGAFDVLQTVLYHRQAYVITLDAKSSRLLTSSQQCDGCNQRRCRQRA